MALRSEQSCDFPNLGSGNEKVPMVWPPNRYDRSIAWIVKAKVSNLIALLAVSDLHEAFQISYRLMAELGPMYYVLAWCIVSSAIRFDTSQRPAGAFPMKARCDGRYAGHSCI